MSGNKIILPEVSEKNQITHTSLKSQIVGPLSSDLLFLPYKRRKFREEK